MKTYTVEFYIEEGWSTKVQANSAEEAEQIVEDKIGEGEEEVKDRSLHFDFGITDSQEVKA